MKHPAPSYMRICAGEAYRHAWPGEPFFLSVRTAEWATGSRFTLVQIAARYPSESIGRALPADDGRVALVWWVDGAEEPCRVELYDYRMSEPATGRARSFTEAIALAVADLRAQVELSGNPG